MRGTITAFFLLIFSMYANAQQSYDTSLIPKNLLPYASAVIRDEQLNIQVKELDNTVYHVKEVVTILNRNGDHMANIEVHHNNNESIRYIKGAIFNSFGIQTAKLSESSFEDLNTTDGFSLFEDDKVKIFKPAVNDYPYTIEYEYEIHSKQSLEFPDWVVNPGRGTSVESSTLSFTCNPDFAIRYKEINMPVQAVITTDTKGLKTYAWQVNNIKAVKDEPYSPIAEKYYSMVKIAPQSFEYQGIKGSFTNWNELGKWVYDKLLAGRQTVSPETADYIKQLTSGIDDPKQKAKKIYEYVQNKTHYVSVQIGIGAYQPFLASDVDKLNYGDCKALVNYTQALLKIAGIESYYCVVEAGDDKVSMLNDFASMDQGDHIILCIPFKNDTIWSDCTNQTIPFGYLGSFTDDRTVLACTPEGGKLLHTPKYTAQDNLQQRKGIFTISAEGELSGDITTVFKGIDYSDREEVIDESHKDQLKSIQNIYSNINNMNIEKLVYNQDKSMNPATTETISLKAPEFASVDNAKFYFSLNPVHRFDQDEVPRQVHNRTTDVYINDGFTNEDEVTYNLPAGFKLDKTPLELTVKKPFGTFTATMHLEGNKLIYKRKLQLIDGTYPKDSYQDLVDFFQSVADADEYNVTLVKNN